MVFGHKRKADDDFFAKFLLNIQWMWHTKVHIIIKLIFKYFYIHFYRLHSIYIFHVNSDSKDVWLEVLNLIASQIFIFMDFFIQNIFYSIFS